MKFANDKNTFVLPITSGINPKFNSEKHINLDIPFDKLENTYLEIVNKF